MDVQELANRLGYGPEKLEAEQRRAGGSQRLLLFRLESAYRTACKRAEKAAGKAWEASQREQADLTHEQTMAVERARVRQRRQSHTPTKRIQDALAELVTLQEGTRASGYEVRVSGDKEFSLPKLAETPLLDQWNERLGRIARLLEHDLDVALGRTSHKNDSGPDRDMRIIQEYESEPASFAALAEAVSESHIRAVRSKHGRRGSDGLPKQEHNGYIPS